MIPCTVGDPRPPPPPLLGTTTFSHGTKGLKGLTLLLDVYFPAFSYNRIFELYKNAYSPTPFLYKHHDQVNHRYESLSPFAYYTLVVRTIVHTLGLCSYYPLPFLITNTLPQASGANGSVLTSSLVCHRLLYLSFRLMLA